MSIKVHTVYYIILLLLILLTLSYTLCMTIKIQTKSHSPSYYLLLILHDNKCIDHLILTLVSVSYMYNSYDPPQYAELLLKVLTISSLHLSHAPQNSHPNFCLYSCEIVHQAKI